MDKQFEYMVVDAFTHERFQGNPAAVVFDPGGLPADAMQSIAREFNLSATAFVNTPTPAGPLDIRWFSPHKELDLCGHGALATVCALIESGRLTDESAASRTLSCRKGLLRIQVEHLPLPRPDRLIWLELPKPQFRTEPPDRQKWADLLGLDPEAQDVALPVMRTQDDDLLVFVTSLYALNDAAPKHESLAEYSRRKRVRGFILASLETVSPHVNAQTRYICSAHGANEDPVTGRVYGPLGAYLLMNELLVHDGPTAAASCIQGRPGFRSGMVRALIHQEAGKGFEVHVGGQCQVTMHGTIRV